jgi:hypothetical protein
MKNWKVSEKKCDSYDLDSEIFYNFLNIAFLKIDFSHRS